MMTTKVRSARNSMNARPRKMKIRMVSVAPGLRDTPSQAAVKAPALSVTAARRGQCHAESGGDQQPLVLRPRRPAPLSPGQTPEPPG